MSPLLAGAVQLAGLVLAPLLPGTIQQLKARLQGRRGPGVLQPYRVLRRLWGKSAVDPEGTTAVYRAAPAVVAACLASACLVVPIAGASADWPPGNDALVLIGLLGLARLALALAAWDTANGFALMGAVRDLAIAVFAEALLALVLLLAALGPQSTDLLAMSDAAAGSAIWSEPAHWCAALGFWLLVLVETGRQPIDNPDTHLELTMIHEGPLLEYAGRDLAYLHWAAAARHWVMLVLAAELFVAHPDAAAGRLALLVVVLALLCAALALTETAQAKLRILRVAPLLGVGMLAAVGGLATWVIG